MTLDILYLIYRFVQCKSVVGIAGIFLAASLIILPGCKEISVSSDDVYQPTAEFEGVVGLVTSDAGLPIADAVVQPQSIDEPGNAVPEKLVLTDADGHFQWRLFPGLYVLTVVAEGYQSQSKTIEVEAQRTINIEFVLDPQLLQQ